MLIKNDFEVAEPVEKVWQFFQNIPQVATCLPGTELTEDLGDDKYKGRVAIRMGPVRLQFAGTADITERDEAAKRIVVNAAGASELQVLGDVDPGAAPATSASGFAIALRAARMALTRVFRRFFVPYHATS